MTAQPQQITIRRPDDWHIHLRDGAMLNAVLPYTSAVNGRAIVMPNLVPPVTSVAAAEAYRARIMAALPAEHHFTPLMTCYLTDSLDADEIERGFRSGIFTAAKLYPAHATTNSSHGVTNIASIASVLERMQEIGMPMLVHGEVTDAHIDIFDREARFIETVLQPLRQQFPGLKVVMEHITTKDGVDYVRAQGEDMAGTITTHHLVINRNHLLVGGIRPHYYCLPVAKRETHRLALVEAATSGDPRFFSGTDSAPHPDRAKESACGCAGCFTAPNWLSICAQVFEEAGALDRLEGFASLNGPAFYRLPPNEDHVRLVRRDEPARFPGRITAGDETVTVFDPGFPLHWHLEEDA